MRRDKFLERSYPRFCHFAHFSAHFRQQSRFASTIFHLRTLENYRDTFLLQISFDEQLRQRLTVIHKDANIFHLCHVSTDLLTVALISICKFQTFWNILGTVVSVISKYSKCFLADNETYNFFQKEQIHTFENGTTTERLA